MSFPETSSEQRALSWAIAFSVLLHAGLLMISARAPSGSQGQPGRLEARLAQRPAAAESPPPPPPAPAPAQKSAARQKKATSRARVLTAERSRGPAVAPAPQWTAAQKAEMDGFLDELAGEARNRPKPTLAQRSLAMAREYGRQMAQQDAASGATLEPRPGGQPADPFSLELYLDALVRRLNRSATFVRNDPRSKGVRPAAVQFRLNPDGSLKSFTVLNAGDQAEEIAFIRSVVERSIPFSPFPPDIDRAARSLGVVICIQPGRGDGGFGFARSDGRAC